MTKGNENYQKSVLYSAITVPKNRAECELSSAVEIRKTEKAEPFIRSETCGTFLARPVLFRTLPQRGQTALYKCIHPVLHCMRRHFASHSPCSSCAAECIYIPKNCILRAGVPASRPVVVGINQGIEGRAYGR